MTMQNATAKATGKRNEKQQAEEEAEATRSNGSTPGSVDTKTLWAQIRGVEGEAAQLQQQIDALARKKSNMVKQIHASLGAGPFQVAGLGLVQIRSRKSKQEGIEPLYFFVTMGNKTVTVID